MRRIKLDVTFAQKDEAKAQGARWDHVARTWYITSDMPLHRFEPWLSGPLKEQVAIERERAEEKRRKQEEWDSLPPRTDDPKELLQLFNKPPVKVEYGFCGMCDSRVVNEWCCPDLGTDYEIRHLADREIGVIRPSELPIIIGERPSFPIARPVYVQAAP